MKNTYSITLELNKNKMFLLQILLPFFFCKIINCDDADSEGGKLHLPHLEFFHPGMYVFSRNYYLTNERWW